MPQRFSDTILEHFMEPSHRGCLEEADGTGVSGTPGSGPFFVFQVRTTDSIVQTARFQSHTCGVTVASGSVLSEMVIGKPLDWCVRLTCDDLIAALDGVPVDKRHVPELVVRTLRAAIDEAQS